MFILKKIFSLLWLGFPGGISGKESICQCRRHKRCRFNTWVRKIPWRRKWQPTPVFLPGESHGQRSLAGYSPWVHKESDMTEHSTHYITLGISKFEKYETFKLFIGLSHMWKKSLQYCLQVAFFCTYVFKNTNMYIFLLYFHLLHLERIPVFMTPIWM